MAIFDLDSVITPLIIRLPMNRAALKLYQKLEAQHLRSLVDHFKLSSHYFVMRD